jgi:Tol biopolymer transport system component
MPLHWLTNDKLLFCDIFGPNGSFCSIGIGDDEPVRLGMKRTFAAPSPDRKYILYEYDGSLNRVDPDGKNAVTLVERIDWGWEHGPVCSPDSKWIAFLKGGDPWVIGADGKNERRIVETSAQEIGLIWSKDSRRLCFTCTGGASDMICYDLQLGKTRDVTEEEYAKLPDTNLSPDSRMSIFEEPSAKSGRIRLSMRTAGTGETRVIASSDTGYCSSGSWSPDSEWVAFQYVDAHTTTPAVRAINVMTGKRIDIADGSGPAWSPDGKYIAFSSNGIIRLYRWPSPSCNDE